MLERIGRFCGLPLFDAWIHAPTEVDPTERRDDTD
jgi:hypothetical protein